MIVKNTNKIKSVVFKVPELMGDQAEKEVIELFESIKELKDKISDLRMEATQLEKQLKIKEEKWSILLPLLDITFESEEIEEIHQKVYVGFNFGTDVNKHLH